MLLIILIFFVSLKRFQNYKIECIENNLCLLCNSKIIGFIYLYCVQTQVQYVEWTNRVLLKGSVTFSNL